MANETPAFFCDLLCFSHLRWDFVYQRPQHLLSRFAKARRVFYIEEPIFDSDSTYLEVLEQKDALHVVRLHLPVTPDSPIDLQKHFLSELIKLYDIRDYVAWYYTPMALDFTRDLKPRCTVYDCMDELSAFAGASKRLRDLEALLLSQADLVFAGGRSLYESKKDRHSNVHLFPSSVDADHFSAARHIEEDPEEIASIPHPRIGFFGVIDERLDSCLLGDVANLRPDWQFIMIGPTVKIDPASLPTNPNIHYLGIKQYEQLPSYIAGWDVAMMPFALNEATRFISPTKIPEYLAAGKPVVSTPINDVLPWRDQDGLVRIASSPAEFVCAIEDTFSEPGRDEWLRRVDAKLATMSWDETWKRMDELIRQQTNPI